MKILIDMNLSPAWVDIFQKNNIEAVHWSTIGNPSALDSELLSWAKENQHIVFTHDLDFGAILASTNVKAPSVIQVRTQNLAPNNLQKLVLKTIQDHNAVLNQGALLVIDEKRSRIRILPLEN